MGRDWKKHEYKWSKKGKKEKEKILVKDTKKIQ